MIEIKNTKKSESKNNIMDAIKVRRANRTAIMKLKKHLKGTTVAAPAKAKKPRAKKVGIQSKSLKNIYM